MDDHGCRECVALQTASTGKLVMLDKSADTVWNVARREKAIARWRGDSVVESHDGSSQIEATIERPSIAPPAGSELVDLQVRLTAVENLLIGLLSAASLQELGRARDVALRRSSKPAC